MLMVRQRGCPGDRTGEAWDTTEVLLNEADLPEMPAQDFLLYRRTLRQFECGNCQSVYERVTGCVEQGETTLAVYFADCHRHTSGPEIWFEVSVGSWSAPEVEDHVTFGCRVGEIEDGSESASLFDVQHRQGGMWGVGLSRDQALQHPWLPLFWQVVDAVLLHDPQVAAYRLEGA